MPTHSGDPSRTTPAPAAAPVSQPAAVPVSEPAPAPAPASSADAPSPEGAAAPQCLAAPLARIGFDRDGLHREDVAPSGDDVRYVVSSGASISVADGPDGVRLALEATDPRPDPSHPLVYLGRLGEHRVVAADVPEPSAELDDPGRDLRELRRVAAQLSHEEAGIALTAVGMGAWHRAHRHCPQCGGALAPESAGWVLRCREDATPHFPRTDPAVIMAVRDADDRLLLARNASFRGRFHSVLAGFVEPGETLEGAVAREVREEVGIDVEQVEYAGSQPWPFPRSLMLAFRARAASGSGALALQEEEIAEAAWWTHEDLVPALAAGRIALPGPESIARALIEDWFGGPLPIAE